MPMYIPRAAESLPLNPTAAPNEPAPVSQARSTSLYTLGAALERDRLEHRVGRVAVAVAALRRLASERRRELEPPPRHFRQAIADFEAQIAAINDRLRELAHDDGSNPIQDWSGSDENGR
jgi:hypothetical protein